MGNPTVFMFRPPDGRFDSGSLKGWEDLRATFEGAANVSVIETETNWLFTRDPFILIEDKAYYAAGKNGEHPLHEQDEAVQELARRMAAEGIEIIPVDIEQRQEALCKGGKKTEHWK
jgi:hypothetical protein